jgi:hypothetical protein
MWTSKCGSLEDIEHETLEALAGFGPSEYGAVVKFLNKSIQKQTLHFIVKLTAYFPAHAAKRARKATK